MITYIVKQLIFFSFRSPFFVCFVCFITSSLLRYLRRQGLSKYRFTFEFLFGGGSSGGFISLIDAFSEVLIPDSFLFEQCNLVYSMKMPLNTSLVSSKANIQEVWPSISLCHFDIVDMNSVLIRLEVTATFSFDLADVPTYFH